MAEMPDQQVEPDDVEQAVGVEEGPDRSRILAGAVFVLLLAVPAAFVAGWRMGRSLGRLTGYY
jgi:hypothetical protein